MMPRALFAWFVLALFSGPIWGQEAEQKCTDGDACELESIDIDVFLFGSTPPASASRWMKFVVLGNRNAPFPIVWIAPERFEISKYAHEFFIEMPDARYGPLEKYNENQLARFSCLKKLTRREWWYTVEISQHMGETTRVCALPQKRACGYINRLLKLPDVGWTDAELTTMRDFVRAIKCPGL